MGTDSVYMEFKPTILIVDDDETVRTMVSGMLTKTCNTHVAASGSEALKFLEAIEPHAIISDINMPDIDGITLLSKVSEKYPYLPFIMVTASDQKDVAIKALRAGAFDYQQKPLGAKELKFSVERAVKYRMLEFEKEVLIRRLKKPSAATVDASHLELKNNLEQIHQLCSQALKDMNKPSASIKDFTETIKTLINLSSKSAN